MKTPLLLTMVSFTLLSGCWLKTVDGHTVNTSSYDPDKLIEVAAYDLKCPRGDVKLVILSDYANDVGAEGCGRKIRYVRLGGTERYIANTADRS